MSGTSPTGYPIDRGYERKTKAMIDVMKGRMRASIDVPSVARSANVNPKSMLAFLYDLRALGVLRLSPGVNGYTNVWDFDPTGCKDWGRRVAERHPGPFKHDEPIVRQGAQIRALQVSIKPKPTPEPERPAIDVRNHFPYGGPLMDPVFTAAYQAARRVADEQKDPDAEKAKRALRWMREHGLEDQIK